MNSFDAAVYAFMIVAAVAGFSTGLLRSLATILAYVCAMPIAMAVTPWLSPIVADKVSVNGPWAQTSIVFLGAFLLAGMALGALLRVAVGEMVGPAMGVIDRLGGAMLGLVRVLLVAVTLVLVFDQIIPSDREPAFLQGSHLRPVLSVAGRAGLKSLPPEVTAFIDELKRGRRI
jgi:membrane protein required for colicin V production